VYKSIKEKQEERYTLLGNLSLILQITLITHHNDGEIVLILDPQNLLLERDNFLETLSAGNTIHQQESLTRYHVLLAHCSVFFLAGGIKNI